MNAATNGQRVWISILPPRNPTDGPRTAGAQEPIALVPGIVIDALARPREVLGRALPIQNAVDVISYHALPDGRTFTRRQAQGLLGLNPREHYCPSLDGPEDQPLSREWYGTLLERAAASTEAIVAKPSDKLLADAIAMFGVKPVEPKPIAAKPAAKKKQADAPAFVG